MSKTRPYKEMMQILSRTHDVGDAVLEALELSHKAAIAQAVESRDAIIRKWIKAQISAEEYDVLMAESLAITGIKVSKETPPMDDSVKTAVHLPMGSEMERVRDWAKQVIDDLDAGISTMQTDGIYEMGVFDTISWLLGETEEAPDK